MPQSFTCLLTHLIFSTKYRQPRISAELQPRLFEYFGGTLRNHGCKLLAAGGVPDHVHLLISLSKQLAIADLLRDLKASSSGWIHDTIPEQRAFAWQTGYGAFSVSFSERDHVVHYLARQAEHHRIRTFQEEFREFLDRHGIEYDERYLWD